MFFLQTYCIILNKAELKILIKSMLKKFLFTILTTLFLFNGAILAQEYSDFSTTSSYNIYLNEIKDDFVTVEEEIEIKANNPSYYIPQNSEQIISIKKESLVEGSIEVTNKYGRVYPYTVNDDGENLQLILRNDIEIKSSSPFFAKIKYQTTEYINQNGNIINLYLPGLHKDIKFQEIDTKHNLKTLNYYNLFYHIPAESPEPSFISPSTITTSTTGKFKTYTFPQESRIQQSGWIQLGNTQYYYFKITQEIPQTDFITPEKLSKYTKWLSKNILELTLPQEFHENNQEVFFTKITPNPKGIKTDDEANIIAIFELEANKTQEIVIEGYIKLTHNEKELPNFTLQEYKERVKELNRLAIYTQPDKYWETESSLIKNEANRLLQENTDSTILELIRANYSFVIEKLEYSKEKAAGDNTRLGALKALEGVPAVCMEYADLLIAILRAQGVPARAAFGYGNDPLLKGDLEDRVGHQWVQIWYPNYGWLSVDPTWGETGREYIGGDLDHLLWYTIGDSTDQISDSVIYSADVVNSEILKGHRVAIQAIQEEKVPDLSNLRTLSEIILEYNQEEETLEKETPEVEYILKTTTFGRLLVFIIPIVIMLFAITAVSMIISKIIKKNN